jgi:type IV pilus assembly protein PilC
MKLKLPLFGDVQRKTAISRFTRTLGTLVTSGVPILQALNITRETAGNVIVSDPSTKCMTPSRKVSPWSPRWNPAASSRRW